MTNCRALSIPVILGTTRKGRMSAHAARFMLRQIEKRPDISTELIDLSELPMPIDDAGEEIKDGAFSNKMALADALVIVTPEYNHSFPGLLKHVLDSCLKNTFTKPPASSACRPDLSAACAPFRISCRSFASSGS